MKRFRIELDKSECIACDTCIILCPKYWDKGKDDFAHLIGSKKEGAREVLYLDEPECNIDAAKSCPVSCIYIYDVKKI